jgi:large repetitive protein
VTQPGGGATVSGTSWAVMWLAGSSGTANSYTLTLGGKPMGTTTTSSTGPVSMPFDTKLVVDGSQPLMATVKDATGNTGGSTVNVNVKNGITSAPAPTPTLAASFTNPAAGATISGTASVDMSVTGSTATSRTFRLAVDGTVVSTQTVGGSTASYALNTAGLSNAAHTLSLTVTDSAGGSASATRTVTVSNVVVTPLSASITAPASGATVSGTSTVGMASAGGSTSSASRTYSLAVDGSVVSTQALSGATASYAWNTASVTNGSHTLTLTVTDGAGGSASASSTVTVSNVVATPPPTTGTVKVYITQPTNTATVGGTTWAVIWIAGQSGSSNSYTLTANGKVVASTVTSSAGPVALPWVTNGTANGAATLTATVKDATGNTGVGSINVTVSN